MTPIKREHHLYLEDMLTSMLRIKEYIGKMAFKEFKMNYMIVDAVVRNFEIIGEASKKVPVEIQKNTLKFHGKKCMD